jgi:DNA-binding transcriptional regulator YiaG
MERGAVPTPLKHVVLSRKEIGTRLSALRETPDMTQVELAKVLGTQQAAVSQARGHP